MVGAGSGAQIIDNLEPEQHKNGLPPQHCFLLLYCFCIVYISHNTKFIYKARKNSLFLFTVTRQRLRVPSYFQGCTGILRLCVHSIGRSLER
jgi:hypothetical protein